MAWWEKFCNLLASTAAKLACSGSGLKSGQRVESDAEREVNCSLGTSKTSRQPE